MGHQTISGACMKHLEDLCLGKGQLDVPLV